MKISGNVKYAASTITLLFFIILFSVSDSASDKESINIKLSSTALSFTQNNGQWDNNLLFQSKASGMVIWFGQDKIYYQITRTLPNRKHTQQNSDISQKHKYDLAPGKVESKIIHLSFIDANLNPNISGLEPINYKCNYFMGSNPDQWQTDVPNFGSILYRNIYDGIDLKYYGNGKQLEYDFIIAPEADPSKIKIKYEGAQNISIDNSGRLIIKTNWGEILEAKPVIYQKQNKNKLFIAGEFEFFSENVIGFNLNSDYDHALPLIIDPTLSYSTYLGGGSVDIGNNIAVDSDGDAYIVGKTSSTDFPTLNQYQSDQTTYDAFATKLSSDGSTPIYSTYLGGDSYDEAFDISVDADGNAYITGYTRSTNYPIENEYQTDQIGADVIITKLNSTGNGLIYSTYLGGDGDDIGYAITIDADNYAYLTGTTISSDFPTLNQYQTNQLYYDIFVTKLNTTGDDLVFSTYIGGGQDETGYDIGLDSDNNVYLTGETFSTDFPTQNQYQIDQGLWDAFLLKLNSLGNSLGYSTYLGGTGDDHAYGLGVDNDHTVYVTGSTESNDFPILNPYQTDQIGEDVFVTRFNEFGNGLIYSTYLGGTGDEISHAIDIDNYGSAYITGSTSNDNFPTEGSLQIYQGGLDVFISKLGPDGDALSFSSYLGGNADDIAYGIALDNDANAYITGYTFSTDYTTLNPYQTDMVHADVFVTKVEIGSFICGDANRDEGINILDIVYIINYKYKGGPPPEPLESADVDGVVNINILDVVYLINFKYKSGPEPNCS